jgi:hypothetical protein
MYTKYSSILRNIESYLSRASDFFKVILKNIDPPGHTDHDPNHGSISFFVNVLIRPFSIVFPSEEKT